VVTRFKNKETRIKDTNSEEIKLNRGTTSQRINKNRHECGYDEVADYFAAKQIERTTTEPGRSRSTLVGHRSRTALYWGAENSVAVDLPHGLEE